jgi:hypothetical protein
MLHMLTDSEGVPPAVQIWIVDADEVVVSHQILPDSCNEVDIAADILLANVVQVMVGSIWCFAVGR